MELNTIKAVFNDSEHSAGGTFSKREYYMDKYGYTAEEMDAIEVAVFYLKNIKEKEYRDRLLKCQ